MDTEQLVADIYEAAVVPDRWVEVLSAFSGHFRTRGGVLFAVGPDGVKWLGAGEADQLSADFLTTGWMEHNKRPAQAVKLGHPGFLTDLSAYTEEETHTLPLYSEFLRPRGFYSAAATYVPGLNRDQLFFSIEGFDSHEASNAAIPLLDRFRPHIARAISLSGQFQLQRMRGHTEALNAIGVPAAVVDASGTLVSVNGRFEPLVGAWAQDWTSGLTLTDRKANIAFQSALKALRQTPRLARSIPIPGGIAQDAKVIHLIPVLGEARDLFSRGYVLIAVAGARDDLGNATLIQTLFDLTPAEAKVALGIAQGRSIPDIAGAHHASIHTVRTQIKSVLAKTGLDSQRALAIVLRDMAFGAPAGRSA